MSKNSRKVHGWGGLGNYTEHRTKDGRVSSRTRYHEGKAITTHAPKPSGSGRASNRAAAARPSLIDGGLSTILTGLGILMLFGAVFGAVVSLLNTALEGFWPIARVIVSWVLAAGWGATVLHFISATIERFEENRSPLVWLGALLQIPLIGLGGILAYSVVAVPGESTNAVESTIVSNFGLGGIIGLLPILLIMSIVFAVRSSWSWLIAVPAALGAAFVFSLMGVPGWGTAVSVLALYGLMMVHLNTVED